MIKKNIRVVLFVTLIIILLVALWYSRKVLLLLFSGLLLALVLTSLCNALRRWIPVPQSVALIVVLILGTGILAGIGWLAAEPVARQFDQLAREVPEAVSKLWERVQRLSTYEAIEKHFPKPEELVPSGEVGKIFGYFSSAFEMISSAIFVIFSALFLAANPQSYRKITMTLVPTRYELQAERVTDRSICTLKSWLKGQLIAMTVVGVITGVALAIAGVPLALALGVIAGLAEFIPFVGPLLAAIPAVLLATGLGVEKVLIVVGIMAGVQFLEGNVIMPIVQKKVVDLPPVFTLASVFILGGAFGLVGMFVAAPLVALIMVLIDELYVNEYLKKQVRIFD